MAIPTSITGTTSTPPITAITIPAIIPGTHEFLYNLALSSLACSFSLARSSFISLPTIEFCLFCAEIQISWIFPTLFSSGIALANLFLYPSSFSSSSSDKRFFAAASLSSSNCLAVFCHSSIVSLSGTPCSNIPLSCSSLLLSSSSMCVNFPLNLPASSKISICLCTSSFSGSSPLK